VGDCVKTPQQITSVLGDVRVAGGGVVKKNHGAVDRGAAAIQLVRLQRVGGSAGNDDKENKAAYTPLERE
jgi:hypothetical protein